MNSKAKIWQPGFEILVLSVPNADPVRIYIVKTDCLGQKRTIHIVKQNTPRAPEGILSAI
jgi:hypothetical protein